MKGEKISVKDYILGREELDKINGTKTKKKGTPGQEYRYSVIVQSGCDFVVERRMKGSRKTKRLVILVSQGQYYTESGSTRNKLTERELKAFLSGLKRDEKIPLTEVNWIDALEGKTGFDSFASAFFRALKSSRQEDVKEMMKKGLFCFADAPVLFGDSFGERRFVQKGNPGDEQQIMFRADFAPDQAYMNIGRPGMNDPDVQVYAGYNPVSMAESLLPCYMERGRNAYHDYQIRMYRSSAALYRSMLRLVSARRGISERAVLMEVFPDPSQQESCLFQSFFSFALIEKAYGLDVAKIAMERYLDSDIRDIIPYSQLSLLLFGKYLYAASNPLAEHPMYGMEAGAFMRYLFEEPVKQGYETNMILFLFHWGQTLFLQKMLRVPHMDKYPANLASKAVKLISHVSDLSDLIEKNAWERAAEYANPLEYVGKDYQIIAPKNTEDLNREAIQQSNCVSSYLSKILNCHTRVCFMRSTKPDKADESLVTIEVEGDRVVQAKGRFNSVPSDEETAFLAEWMAKKKLRDGTFGDPFGPPMGLLAD